MSFVTSALGGLAAYKTADNIFNVLLKFKPRISMAPSKSTSFAVLDISIELRLRIPSHTALSCANRLNKELPAYHHKRGGANPTKKSTYKYERKNQWFALVSLWDRQKSPRTTMRKDDAAIYISYPSNFNSLPLFSPSSGGVHPPFKDVFQSWGGIPNHKSSKSDPRETCCNPWCRERSNRDEVHLLGRQIATQIAGLRLAMCVKFQVRNDW